MKTENSQGMPELPAAGRQETGMPETGPHQEGVATVLRHELVPSGTPLFGLIATVWAQIMRVTSFALGVWEAEVRGNGSFSGFRVPEVRETNTDTTLPLGWTKKSRWVDPAARWNLRDLRPNTLCRLAGNLLQPLKEAQSPEEAALALLMQSEKAVIASVLADEMESYLAGEASSGESLLLVPNGVLCPDTETYGGNGTPLWFHWQVWALEFYTPLSVVDDTMPSVTIRRRSPALQSEETAPSKKANTLDLPPLVLKPDWGVDTPKHSAFELVTHPQGHGLDWQSSYANRRKEMERTDYFSLSKKVESELIGAVTRLQSMGKISFDVDVPTLRDRIVLSGFKLRESVRCDPSAASAFNRPNGGPRSYVVVEGEFTFPVSSVLKLPERDELGREIVQDLRRGNVQALVETESHVWPWATLYTAPTAYGTITDDDFPTLSWLMSTKTLCVHPDAFQEAKRTIVTAMVHAERRLRARMSAIPNMGLVELRDKFGVSLKGTVMQGGRQSHRSIADVRDAALRKVRSLASEEAMPDEVQVLFLDYNQSRHALPRWSQVPGRITGYMNPKQRVKLVASEVIKM